MTHPENSVVIYILSLHYYHCHHQGGCRGQLEVKDRPSLIDNDYDIYCVCYSSCLLVAILTVAGWVQ